MIMRPLLAASLALCALPAHAATSGWTETPGGRVRVVLEEGGAAKEGVIRGALQIELKPGWKTYWRNPGDSGVPPQISAEGAAVQVAFPAPVRFGDGDAGYAAPVSLPLTFAVEPGKPLTQLKGQAFLGVCHQICVPVQAEFDLPLQADPAPALSVAARTIVETAFDRLPAPASDAFGVRAARLEKDRAVFDIAAPDPDAPAELFLSSDTLSLSTPAPEAGQSRRFVARLQGAARKSVVDYTLVQNGKAVSGRVDLD